MRFCEASMASVVGGPQRGIRVCVSPPPLFIDSIPLKYSVAPTEYGYRS